VEEISRNSKVFVLLMDLVYLGYFHGQQGRRAFCQKICLEKVVQNQNLESIGKKYKEKLPNSVSFIEGKTNLKTLFLRHYSC